MLRLTVLVSIMIAGLLALAPGHAGAKTDTIDTAAGELRVTLVGHGSVMFEFGGKVIHVDPFGKVGDYTKLPGADLILLTHHHRDHMDLDAINRIRAAHTKIVMTRTCAEQAQGQFKDPIVMANGDETTVEGLKIEAVPAYNLAHMRMPGLPYHPKGEGNGYIVTFGDKRVYIAGDTENTPEMKALKDIYAAFLPMNLPYTMDSAMAADAARALRPRVLYPYHNVFGEDQVPGFLELFKGVEGVEVRLLK